MMKKIFFAKAFLMLIAVFIFYKYSYAVPSKELNFQGMLTDSAGKTVTDGSYSVTFLIYDTASGGTALWQETQTVTTTSGLFSTELGKVTAITLPFDKDYYLAIKVGSDAEMSPRKLITVSGYSVNSDTVDGLHASTSATAATLYPLNSSAKFPYSVLDLSGNIKDADVSSISASKINTVGATNMVTKIIAGTNVSVTPTTGVGEVTISSASGAGGLSLCASGTLKNVAGALSDGSSICASKGDHVHSVDNNTITGAMIVDSTITDSDISSISSSKLTGVVVSAPSSNQTIQPAADVTPLILKDDTSGATASLLDIQNSAGTSLVKVDASGSLFVGSPTVTTAKVSVLETNSSNHAGYFVLDNATNPNSAVYGRATGTGNGGKFEIVNVSNSNSAVYASTDGTGALFFGNTNGAGSLLQLQKSSANTFVVDNSGNLLIGNPTVTNSKISALSTDTTNTPAVFQINNVSSINNVVAAITNGSGILYSGDTTGAGNLLRLQKSGLDKFVVDNSGSLFIGNPSFSSPSKVNVLETGTTGGTGKFVISNASNTNSALYGETNGAGGNAITAKFNATADGVVFYGESASTGTNPKLLKLVSDNGGTGTTQLEVFNNGNTYVYGNLDVSGSLSKGSGSFLIDHPLDPENKVLRHSFVESPEMKNVYDGIIKLNQKGEAVVILPDYFESLNIQFRYQLTPVGHYAPLFIKQEIKESQFIIASGNGASDAGLKVSWQVTGVRNDPYAQVNPIITEEVKGTGTATGYEKGKLIHPEAYSIWQQMQPEKKFAVK